jgi:3-deoxy-D-manno-octulosonic-acid transferase
LELPRLAYHFISSFLEPLAPRFLSPRLQEDPFFWQGRLGHYSFTPPQARTPRIWLHAASVGEVTGALPIVRTLRERVPGAEITLTVTTLQGFQFARTTLSPWAQILPFPLDFPGALERAFERLRPDLYVALEGEFWPNLFLFLERYETPAVLLNGQLSQRSADWYSLLKSLFRPIFKQFVCLAMHSEEDRKNVLLLGADPERTCVLGSSKYDALFLRKDLEKVIQWRQLLDFPGEAPVLVGGSLRRLECIKLLEVFRSLRNVSPRLIGIFAPRHMAQISAMAKWLDEQAIAFQLLSQVETGRERRSSSVILVDRIGILFDLYALGDLIFCGGTLEPFGGHNIMEPAAWGKPVFYGPHLQKVADEHNILQASSGGFLVQDSQDLLKQWSYWIRHLQELKRSGEKGEEALLKLGGVSARQVEIIVRALAGKLPVSHDGVPGKCNLTPTGKSTAA